MPLTPGSTFERYAIEGLLGRGGMGEVYRAIDTRLHRPVALKVLRTDKAAEATVTDAGGVQRLLREARAAAALNHANSVAIYELGEAEGIAYIAMELVRGASLRHYIASGHLVSIDTKILWLVDAARALWAAHRAGLVHRDVKPGNIMVSEEGVVKVLDFGLAKATRAPTSSDPAPFETLMGQVLGTPRYMSPEQLEGAPADAASDQFAFGITCYELLSGVYPGGPLAGAPTPLDTIVSGASAELAAIVSRMMARQPAERFPTMESAAHSLRACVGSVPQVALADVARPKLARAIEQPTVVQAAAGLEGLAEESIAEPVATARDGASSGVAATFGKTLPLARPITFALNAGNAAVLARQHAAPSPLASAGPPAPALGRTVPLGHSTAANVPNPTSGVYPSGAQAGAASFRGDTTGSGPAASLSRPTPARPAARRMWMVLLFVAGIGIFAGGLIAWLLRR